MLIYITGAPRCGKSTLAKKLISDCGNTALFSLDAFSKSIRSEFTDFKMYSGKLTIQPDMNKAKFLSLVHKYIRCFCIDFPSVNLIVEGCHFSPDEFIEVFPDAKIICLGITKSFDSIIDAINNSEWMSALDGKIKNEYAKLIFDYSLKMKGSDSDRFLYIERNEINYKEIVKEIM